MTRPAQPLSNLSVVNLYAQVHRLKMSSPLSSFMFSPQGDVPTIQELDCSSDECTPKCDFAWEKSGDRCYFWSQEKLFWGEAEKKCRDLGGHLASVTTQEIHDYLKLNVSKDLISTQNILRFRRRLYGTSGLEEQTNSKKGTGHGPTAVPGTSPDGE